MIKKRLAYRWYYVSNKQWEPFTSENNRQLEKAYQKEESIVIINANNTTYNIDFLLFQQQNLTTKKIRKIKRVTRKSPKKVKSTKTPIKIPKSKHSECPICITDKEPMSCTSNCNHPPEYCKDCIITYLKSKISEKQPQIQCLKCPSYFTPYDIKLFLPPELEMTWSNLTATFFLDHDENTRYCANTKCESVYLIDPDDTFFVCQRCQTKTCIRHRVVFHDGISCAEYEMFSLKPVTANDKMKHCPKCNHLIEKNEGCNHLTCRCGYEFCWICLAAYDPIRKEGNHLHEIHCPFHTDNLISK